MTLGSPLEPAFAGPFPIPARTSRPGLFFDAAGGGS
jgi:hypothetical protein